MERLISSYSLNSADGSKTFSLPLPNKCPICSVAYANEPIEAYYFQNQREGYRKNLDVYTMYFCPHCERVFFVQYLAIDNSPAKYPLAVIAKIYPSPSGLTPFSKSISDVSPKFVEIYHQAEKAENDNLSYICGMGYRRSLEFLIKDYLISIKPNEASAIESALLAKCISTYVDNDKIKTLATASAWLGNDESHYARKHQDYDVQDLKRFINTVVAFIEYELNYYEAFNLLSNPR